MKGYFEINRVPGNFHISYHSYGDIVAMLQMQGYKLDFSYQVRHLSFGRDEDFKVIQSKFKKLGVTSPLDGQRDSAENGPNGEVYGLQTNYYLIAVPSFFKDTSGNTYQVY